MALIHLGTVANNSLSGFNWSRNPSPSNLALLMASIKDDLIVTHPIYPGAVQTSGLLYIPNRGVLQMFPGDVVGVDDTGWPILVSSNSINNGVDWTRS